ncbi:MAG: sensor histidine kinase, partial [Nitrospinae bacterium]|nr:sensor histidine kinase [Nitrospinota bacterium]
VFAFLIVINISVGILGIYALCDSPVILFAPKSSSQIKEHKLKLIEGIELDEPFTYRLPEFFFPKEEAKWWRMQEAVYKALAAKDSVAVEYRDKDGVNRKIKAEIGYATFIEVIKKTGLIYLAGLIYLISAVIVFRRHRSESGLTLAYFFLSGSLYLISSAPVVSRQITLIPLYFKIFISLVHISAGGMITLVHFAFVFPRGKEIISKKPSLPYIILYGYFSLTTILYLSRITAFGTTFPTLVFWIAAMLIAFSHSLIKEKDNFLRKQISLSLFAPLMAGSVFVLLHLLPGILGTTSMEFTYFALFSLILPYALPSAMDNLRLYQERLEMEKNSQKEKERIRQELHDNLANDLTSIRFLSEVAEQSLSKESQLKDSITTIKETALKNIEQIRDFIWAINTEEEGDLLSHFKTYTARLFKSFDIEIQYKDASHSPPRFNTHLRFNIFNIFKEAMTNILKHSKAKKVKVELSINENGLYMAITDDGIGFNPSVSHDDSYGVRNMRKRAEEMGGILNIISKEDKGTEIFLILPQKYLI